MDRLTSTFARLRRQRRTALIPFIMGGDPALAATGPLLEALAAAGADVLEVGIPFSDPLADGPVIQAASARALRKGATPGGVLAAIRRIRRRVAAPVVVLTYWNPLLQFGGSGSPHPFLSAAARAGVDGIIVPDLPVEEGAGLRAAALARGIALIFLAAPTSPPERLRLISRRSCGFIYYVSVTGTTGFRRHLGADVAHGVRQLKLLTTKPVCVGFGISSPAQAAAVARVADGVIIGSALVDRLAGAATRRALLGRAGAFVRRMRRAVG